MTKEWTTPQVTFARADDTIYVLKGGVTGNESWYLANFPWDFDRDFAVCMGCDKYDKLVVSGLNMSVVYLHLVKNAEALDENGIHEPAPEFMR